jgi:hypothetical protein
MNHTYRGHASFSDICGAWFGFGSGFGMGFTLTLLFARVSLLLATLLSHTRQKTQFQCYPLNQDLVTWPRSARAVFTHTYPMFPGYILDMFPALANDPVPPLLRVPPFCAKYDRRILSCSSIRHLTSFLRMGSHLLSRTPNAFIFLLNDST